MPRTAVENEFLVAENPILDYLAANPCAQKSQTSSALIG
jgi:hypothetical protein